MIRDVVDYHMPYLVSRELGVFAKCGEYGHEIHNRLDAAAKPPARGIISEAANGTEKTTMRTIGVRIYGEHFAVLSMNKR